MTAAAKKTAAPRTRADGDIAHPADDREAESIEAVTPGTVEHNPPSPVAEHLPDGVEIEPSAIDRASEDPADLTAVATRESVTLEPGTARAV